MKRLVLLASLLMSGSLLAELSLPKFFSDHMVLQRESEAAIWGTAEPKAKVTVTFKGEEATAQANANGEWRLAIPTGKADAKGAVLSVTSGRGTIEIQDVLVGEVWFASGQSNMVFTVGRSTPLYDELAAKTTLPGLRMFNAEMTATVDPQSDIEGEWSAASPETVPGYSGTAFFFARKLHQDLGIPVGVIKSAWGGKPVETFTSREALNTLPGTKALVDATLEADKSYDPKRAKAAYETRLKAWETQIAEWRQQPEAERGRAPKRPTEPKRPLATEGKPGVLFNGMIHPFIGYTMRGAIWYQGEGNAKPGAVPYDQTLPLLIRDWRERWDDDFSFYFVQLANFRQPSTEAGTPDPWALLQDRMRLVLDTTPKTGMAIINDVGEADDIHPKNKKDVGERLALWALAKDYGKDGLYSGPLYKSHNVGKKGIRITFDQAGDGLKVRDGGELQRFEIAGEDRTWHWAEAKVRGKNAVIVSSPKVAKPVAVRYAWASNPEGANLVNSDGLPASVFRTDDWDDVEPVELLEELKNAERRRDLGAEIRALNAKRKEMDRKSPEFEKASEKLEKMWEEFRALAPKQ